MSFESRIQNVYNVYSMYTGNCEELIKRTRPLSVRVSKLTWKLYDDLFTTLDKEVLKAVIEGTIIAIAKQKLNDNLPCKELLEARLVYAIARTSGSQNISFNINVNMNKAENRSEVKLNIDMKEIEEIKRLLEHLLQIASSSQNWRVHKILKQRVLRAEKILDRLLEVVN